MSHPLLKRLTDPDDFVILETLYALGKSELSSGEIPEHLARGLIYSDNDLIRERAAFYFGAQAKDVRFCQDYINLLNSEKPERHHVISAALFAIIACCRGVDIINLADKLATCLEDDIVRLYIGTVIVGYIFWSAKRINEDELKLMIARSGSPDRAEVSEALRILHNSDRNT